MRDDMDRYISKFDIYQGKNTMPRNPNFLECFGLGESVVAYFTADLVGKNHKVYFDNYFSSVPLMEYLKTNKIFACATIRSNRKYLPNNMKKDNCKEANMISGFPATMSIIKNGWTTNLCMLFQTFMGLRQLSYIGDRRMALARNLNVP